MDVTFVFFIWGDWLDVGYAFWWGWGYRDVVGGLRIARSCLHIITYFERSRFFIFCLDGLIAFYNKNR